MNTIQELIQEWITESGSGNLGAGIGLVHLSQVQGIGTPQNNLIKSWAKTTSADQLARHLAAVLHFQNDEAGELDEHLEGDETLKALIKLNQGVGLADWRQDSYDGIFSFVLHVQKILVDDHRAQVMAAAEAGSLDAARELIQEFICSGYAGELEEAMRLVQMHHAKMSFDEVTGILREIMECSTDYSYRHESWCGAAELALDQLCSRGAPAPQWLLDQITWRCSAPEPYELDDVERMLEGMSSPPTDVFDIVKKARQQEKLEAEARRRLQEEEEEEVLWRPEDWEQYHQLVRNSEGDPDAKYRLAMGLILGDYPGGGLHRGLELLATAALSGQREAVVTVQEICSAGLVAYFWDLWQEHNVAGAAYALGVLHCFLKPESTPLDSFGRVLVEEDQDQYWDEEKGNLLLEKASAAGHRRATELLADLGEV